MFNLLKQYFRSQIQPLFFRLLLITLIYTLLRVIFYFYNLHYFPDCSFSVFSNGIRFDLVAIFYINSLYIIAILLPFKFVFNKIYQIIANIIFVFSNSVALAFSCGDIAYFPVVLKRLTADIFSYLQIGFDFSALIPVFFRDYWALVLLFILLIFLLILICRKIKVESKINSPKPVSWSGRGLLGITFIAMIFFALIVMRGGIQKRPLTIVEASKFATSQNIPLVLNTPFSMLFTIGAKTNIELHYFSTLQEAEELTNPIHTSIFPRNEEELEIENVVVLILEGFSPSLIADKNPELEGYQGFCPFIHNIETQSISFNGFANGRRTMEALPSIFLGIPSLMDNFYAKTPFSNNYIKPSLQTLTEKGYKTMFYHGAKNGSMLIDACSYMSGFEHYYGKNEFTNSKENEELWGISDRTYLQYVAHQLAKEKTPFFATILTLSSHDPYEIPKDGLNMQFPENVEHPMQTLATYADNSVKEFFDIVSKQPWYSKTLFVITSDHTVYGSSFTDKSIFSDYKIPIIFYHPQSKIAEKRGIMQQIDIMPSVLSYLKIEDPLFSFGKNVFAPTTEEPYAIYYNAGIYYYVTDNYGLEFDGKKVILFYKISHDGTEKWEANAPKDLEKKLKIELKLKSFIQSFTTRISRNQFYVTAPEHSSFVFPNSKIWAHHVNTKDDIEKKINSFDGIEVDLIYSSTISNFYIAHNEIDTLQNFTIDDWFNTINNLSEKWYWLDIKNLDETNATDCANVLSQKLAHYKISHKTIVESKDYRALKKLKDKGLFVSLWLTEIWSTIIWKIRAKYRVNYLQPFAISADYGLSPLLDKTFPKHNILYWQHAVDDTPENRKITQTLANTPNVKIVLVDYDAP